MTILIIEGVIRYLKEECRLANKEDREAIDLLLGTRVINGFIPYKVLKEFNLAYTVKGVNFYGCTLISPLSEYCDNVPDVMGEYHTHPPKQRLSVCKKCKPMFEDERLRPSWPDVCSATQSKLRKHLLGGIDNDNKFSLIAYRGSELPYGVIPGDVNLDEVAQRAYNILSGYNPFLENRIQELEKIVQVDRKVSKLYKKMPKKIKKGIRRRKRAVRKGIKKVGYHSSDVDLAYRLLMIQTKKVGASFPFLFKEIIKKELIRILNINYNLWDVSESNLLQLCLFIIKNHSTDMKQHLNENLLRKLYSEYD